MSALDVAATAAVLAGQKQGAKLDGVNLLPFLTGENKAAPHDALFWRWRSQAAVLEFPWKLIHPGTNQTYLFNVTLPDGETKNLLAQNPAIAARLDAKLKTWAATLQPPGPPERNNEQDKMFFAAHVDKTIQQATKRRPAAAAAQAPHDLVSLPCPNCGMDHALCHSIMRVSINAYVIAAGLVLLSRGEQSRTNLGVSKAGICCPHRHSWRRASVAMPDGKNGGGDSFGE